MKKIKYLLFLVFTILLFNTNVKASTGLGNVGNSALLCAYCNQSDCYYVLQNVNETMDDLSYYNKFGNYNYSDSYQRIFKNTTSKEVTLQNSSTFNWNVYFSKLSTTNKCYNYLHYIHGGSDTSNSAFDYYFYIFDDNANIDINKYNFGSDFVDFYIQANGLIDYELMYQYGLDTYGEGEDDIDNSKIKVIVSDIISSNETKNIINSKFNVDDNPIDSGNGATDKGECSVDHTTDKACGSLYFIPKEIPFFTNLIMNLIKIITPIVLVIKGSIDLIKAMTGGNEQEISKSRAKFFKRLIPAVLVFLIILVVQFIFGLFATDSESNTFLACSNCFLNGKCSNTPQSKIDEYCEGLEGNNEIPNKDFNQGGNGNSGQGSIANPPIASSGFNPNVKDKFSESNYNSKKITIPGTEKCRQNGNCVENIHEEGYIRVSDGVFYFPYDTSLNGNINGKGKGTEGINSIFEQRLNKFFAAARLAGYDISMIRNVGDGYRDIETQKFYYCCYTGEYLNSVRSCDGCDKKTCIGKGTCNNGSLASSPGTSPHGWGIAVDLNLYKLGGNTKYKDAIVWAHAHAEEYGLAFPVSNEDWHIEPLYVCDINGKSSKYGSCKRQKNYICKENKSILPNNEVGTGSSYCNP